MYLRISQLVGVYKLIGNSLSTTTGVKRKLLIQKRKSPGVKKPPLFLSIPSPNYQYLSSLFEIHSTGDTTYYRLDDMQTKEVFVLSINERLGTAQLNPAELTLETDKGKETVGSTASSRVKRIKVPEIKASL